MSKETRSDLLAAIASLGQLHPDCRLGQTLANLAMTAGRMDAGGVWDLEDDEALAAAQTLIEQQSELASSAKEYIKTKVREAEASGKAEEITPSYWDEVRQTLRQKNAQKQARDEPG